MYMKKKEGIYRSLRRKLLVVIKRMHYLGNTMTRNKFDRNVSTETIQYIHIHTYIYIYIYSKDVSIANSVAFYGNK